MAASAGRSEVAASALCSQGFRLTLRLGIASPLAAVSLIGPVSEVNEAFLLLLGEKGSMPAEHAQRAFYAGSADSNTVLFIDDVGGIFPRHHPYQDLGEILLVDVGILQHTGRLRAGL